MGIHSHTSMLEVNDPRGLQIRNVDYWRDDENRPAETRIHRTALDVAGHAVKQWDPRLWALQATDPLTPANLTSVHALNGEVLRSDSTDAGVHIKLRGLGNQVLSAWDSRGTRHENEYDQRLRPTAKFEEAVAEPRRCVERLEYGRPGEGDAQCNQFGELIQHFDPAGCVLFTQFAISGQSTENTRHFTQDSVAPNWPPLLDDCLRLLEPGPGATTQWRFTPQGTLRELIDAKGHRQTFEMAVDGRLRGAALQLKHQSSAHLLVSDIRYNAEGQVVYEMAGNGVSTTLLYRPQDGRLLERLTKSTVGVVLQHWLYQYDPMGNVLSIEDKALPVRYFANQRIEPIRHFRYDSLYQLIEATGWESLVTQRGPGASGQADPAAIGNYRQTFRYDASGNLLQLSHVGGQAQGHQLSAARYSNRCLSWRNGTAPTEADIAAAFDSNGNLLALEPGRNLQWNLRNQLSRVTPITRESGLDDRESYLYDGAGLRVRKITERQTPARAVIAETRYLPGLELRSHSGNNEHLQVISVAIGLNSVRVLHRDGGPDRYRYGCTDHVGSIGLELDGDGQIISREMFYAFGATAWQDGDVSDKSLGYSGKEEDATGLHYFGFRYYAAWLQRWVSPDPGEEVDGPNRYRAMRNNPLFYRDQDGLVSLPTQASGSAALRMQESSRGLPQVSSETRERIAQGAQVIGKTLSYAKHPLIGAVGSVLETGGRVLEVYDAQAQMQSRQRSPQHMLPTSVPVASNTSSLLSKLPEMAAFTGFNHQIGETAAQSSAAPSALSMQLFAAGFGSATPPNISMALMAEDPSKMGNKRGKRATVTAAHHE
ncbi:RHS repeat domain-containing protein [Pseudomonas sp. NPDC088429]|uniref:RHS repeat domain-containing protein n=1 Tax=Pseudomonas sp. NPDC088429 TaxID=3364455 RepID=UPI003824E0DC